MKEISHVAIIMDGNGRWGLKKHKTRNFGNKKEKKKVKKIIDASKKKKIKYLTCIPFQQKIGKDLKMKLVFYLNYYQHI